MFNFSSLSNLGDGPGVLDPFSSLPEKTPARVQIVVNKIETSQDPGKKPCALAGNKGFDRKMHYMIFETRATLVDAAALQIIEHPDSEPLPARTDETWLLMVPAEVGGRPWTAEEKQTLSDRIKRAEAFLSPMYGAASLPLTADDGKPRGDMPAAVAKMSKGRKGPCGKFLDGQWDEIKGQVFNAEITRRQGNDGKDYYDYKILGVTPPHEIGQVYVAE